MSALPENYQQPLGWTSTPDDFKAASEKAIIQRYDEVSAVGNARRVSQTVLVKKASPREYKNQKFASELFNDTPQQNPDILRPLRVPNVFRYIQGCSESKDGYLVMEFLDGLAWLDGCDSDTNERVVRAVRRLHRTIILEDIPGPLYGKCADPLCRGYAEGFPWGRGWGEAYNMFMSMEDVVNFIDHKHNLRARQTRTAPEEREKVRIRTDDLVLCHGNLEAKNIIILADEQIAILDWKWLCCYPVVFELACLSTIYDESPHEGQRYVLEILIFVECTKRRRKEIEAEMKVLCIAEAESLLWLNEDFPDGRHVETFIGNRSGGRCNDAAQ